MRAHRTQPHGRHHQPARSVRRGSDVHDPGDRHQGIGKGQQFHRAAQTHHHLFDRRGGLDPHHQRQLEAAHPAEHRRVGHLRDLRYPAGAGLVFFAYIGFDAVSTAAQEARNPQKDMPIGILGSLFVCTLLYVIVSALLTGMVNYKELLALQTSSPPDYAAPMAYAMKHVGAPEWVRISVDVGAVLGLGSVILVMLLGQSRVFYSMSRDGLLGGWAGRVHPKFRTPYLSTIYTGIAVGLATGLLPLQLLGQLVNIGTLLAFVLVCAGVWILRKKRPDLDRPCRTR